MDDYKIAIKLLVEMNVTVKAKDEVEAEFKAWKHVLNVGKKDPNKLVDAYKPTMEFISIEALK